MLQNEIYLPVSVFMYRIHLHMKMSCLSCDGSILFHCCKKVVCFLFFFKSKYVDLRLLLLFFFLEFHLHGIFPTSVTFVMIVPILHLTIPIVFHSLSVLVIYDKFMLGTKASIIHTKVRKN